MAASAAATFSDTPTQVDNGKSRGVGGARGNSQAKVEASESQPSGPEMPSKDSPLGKSLSSAFSTAKSKEMPEHVANDPTRNPERSHKDDRREPRKTEPKPQVKPAPEPPDEAVDEDGGEEEDASIKSFRRKFGLKGGLDTVTQAREDALDQFGQIVSGQAPQTQRGDQPSPSGWQGHQGNGQPANQPSVQQQQPPARPPGSDLPRVFDDDQLSELEAELGKPAVKALVGKFQAAFGESAQVKAELSQAKQAMAHMVQIVERMQVTEFQKTIRDFFGRKVNSEGEVFRDLLGSSKTGVSRAQESIRQSIVRNAALFQQSNPHLDNDDCLELSLQYTLREHQQEQQRQAGRRELEQQVIRRDSQRSLTPSGGSAPTRAQTTKATLDTSIRKFITSVHGNRR